MSRNAEIRVHTPSPPGHVARPFNSDWYIKIYIVFPRDQAHWRVLYIDHMIVKSISYHVCSFNPSSLVKRILSSKFKHFVEVTFTSALYLSIEHLTRFSKYQPTNKPSITLPKTCATTSPRILTTFAFGLTSLTLMTIQVLQHRHNPRLLHTYKYQFESTHFNPMWVLIFYIRLAY